MNVPAQVSISEDTFKNELKEWFTKSISGLDPDNRTGSLEGATSCLILEDKDKGIISMMAIYKAETKDEATSLKIQLGDLVEGCLPVGDYSRTKSYSAKYFDYLKIAFEFNSDVFAEKKKRPSIDIGAVKRDDGYSVELILFEPYFKNQYSPKWE
jgi:hypothetical protein